MEKVVAVALAGGEVTLGKTRAKQVVARYVEGLVEAIDFARALVASLEPIHFQGSVDLPDPPYKGWFDFYIRPLPTELVERYGLHEVDTWYVKLKLVESEDADMVVCVSMHPPEKAWNKRSTP